MKYIIDANPGIDDAIAISMAIKNKLDIIGFTVATGNIETNKAINNLKVIEDILNINVPIYKGNRENVSNSTSVYANGIDGLGYAVYPENKNRRIEKMYAENFIIKSAKKYKKNLTIICLGPLTNLANAIKRDKKLPTRINKIIMLGTSYNQSKLSNPDKEFNINVDPKAAKMVMTSPFKNIYAISREVASQIKIEKDYILNLRNSNDLASRFISNISEKSIEYSYQYYNTIGLIIPSLATILYALDNEIYKFEDFTCEIIVRGTNKGQCFLTKEKSNVHISTSIEVNKFKKLFKDTFK